MSLEGIGEGHFVEFVRKNVLRGYTILPPGTIVSVDFVVGRHITFIEIEDTIFEVYSGTKQLIRVATISRIYDAGFLLIVPYPEKPLKATLPISYFFKMTGDVGLRRKELWLVRDSKKPYVVSIIMRDDEPVEIQPSCPKIVLKVSVEDLTQISQKLEGIDGYSK